jgi:hypothetical protein
MRQCFGAPSEPGAGPTQNPQPQLHQSFTQLSNSRPPPTRLLLWAIVILALCLPRAHAALRPEPTPAYFAVCAVVKDRPEYVLEWLEYHLALGVQAFYLFDTDNPDHAALKSALQKHIDSGRLELYSLPRVTPRTVPMLQLRIYDMCLNNLRSVLMSKMTWTLSPYPCTQMSMRCFGTLTS